MIIGKKGKGKTKQLLDKVNTSIKTANGNIVYIDKSSKHMLELNNKIRLIDASGYGLKNSDEFIPRHAAEIGDQVDFQPVQCRARFSGGGIRMLQREGINGDAEDQEQQYRKHKFRGFFNSLFNAQKNHRPGDHHKNKKPQNRGHTVGEKSVKKRRGTGPVDL